MKRFLIATALIGAVLLVPGDVAYTEDAKLETSHESAYFTFQEESKGISVLVYSWPSYWRQQENFFPLVVAVGLGSEKKMNEKGKESNEPVIIELENFLLIDSQGNSYYPATYEEIQGQYKFLMGDKNLLVERPMSTGNQFDVFGKILAPFYPVDGGIRMRITEVSMEPFTWFQSMIYFQLPDPGLGGVMTLSLTSKKIDPSIDVKFRLPEKHHEKDKKDEHNHKAGE